jgi:hypothetical protein
MRTFVRSCGDDDMVTVWWYDESKPLFPDDE